MCDAYNIIQVVSYYINDGVYGAFKHQFARLFTPKVLKVIETLYTKLQNVLIIMIGITIYMYVSFYG